MNVHKLLLRIGIFMLFLNIFLIGWFSNSIFSNSDSLDLEKPFYSGLFGENKAKEISSPYDHIRKEQIHVFPDRITIDVKDASWTEFLDTNSMDPLLDLDANSFEIKPKSPESIYVGDVISYQSEYASGLTVHRVVEISEDEQGWYCIVKGDNLSQPDPGNIRFEQINGVLIGIIY
ncbi:hypothetical protein GOV06_01335 [Candidatus Woesearchaeota archaeon]|nr:hypothetical protein [Candidatus Woesearchaeota archaeon]